MNRIFLLLIVLISLEGTTQTSTPWHGKKCAVVLTYDDAIVEHLDNALPVLDSLNLKATFYITAYAQACRERMNDWKKAAANGHELGNHTLYHPCIGNIAGREWVKPAYDLSQYSVQRITDEIRMTNVFLQALDGKTQRTFAFTCADTKAGGKEFFQALKNDFIAARSVRNDMHTIDKIDLYNTDCFLVNGQSAEEMIGWVQKAMETQSLLVILFHGVDGGNALNVSLPAHSRLLHFVKDNEKDIWITPMVEAAAYIKDWQEHNN